MPTQEHREIPFNYTSASDGQIVTFLFGAETWGVLEQLRQRRVTGRSARLLMRFMGDRFMLRRNPFLWQQLLDSRRRRRELLTLVRRDLDIVERNARDEALVQKLIATCKRYLGEMLRELSAARRQRQRVRRALGAVIGEVNVTFDPFANPTCGRTSPTRPWAAFPACRRKAPTASLRPPNSFSIAPIPRP
jgi:hypothetical protein